MCVHGAFSLAIDNISNSKNCSILFGNKLTELDLKIGTNVTSVLKR